MKDILEISHLAINTILNFQSANHQFKDLWQNWDKNSQPLIAYLGLLLIIKPSAPKRLETKKA